MQGGSSKRQRGAPRGRLGLSAFVTVLAKWITESTVSEVHQRIGQPLAYARGSDQSRDCKGAIAGNTRPYF
jgi:hypothetical protein